jgi:hypothetical protein
MQRNSPNQLSLKRHVLWRCAVSLVVAYALVITALLSSVLQAEWAAQVAAGLVGEHCITDARAAGTDPAAPPGQPNDSFHCGLCNLAAGPAVLPLEPAVEFIALLPASAPAIGSDQNLPLWRGHPGKLPRGPPHGAVAV